MSAGAFTRTKYQASYGDGTAVHPIRVQDTTLTCSVGGVDNDPPAGAISNPISAVVSRGRRSKGLVVRTVTLEAPTTSPPTGYKPGGLTTIPCLTQAFFDACEAADDSTTVSYNGSTTYKVAYVSAESVK